MDSLLGQCASHSTNPANSFFVLLLQSLLTAHCSISSPEQWPRDFAPEALTNGFDTYDFVIIGAGSAGSVLANRLTENPNWKVLLLEAGGDPPIESEIPPMYLNLLNTTNTWNFYAEPNEFSGRHYPKGTYLPAGKMLGGSGGINTMLYVRGNPKDYDRWVELGNEGWDSETVLKYFKKSEDMQMTSFLSMNRGRYHSAGGELKVSSFYSVEPLKNILLEAALERKHNEVIDINAREHVGFSIVGGTLYNGQRHSPAKAFLNPVADRKNLHIVKNAQVTKILFTDEKKANGVNVDIQTADGVKSLTVKINKDVIVSAGSINSPKLLQLSGIGPSDLLNRHQIPVIADLPVGENLHDHVAVPLFYTYHKSRSESTTEESLASEIYMYTLHRVGPLATLGVTDLVGLINTKNRTVNYPNVQFNFVSFQRGMIGLEAILTNLGYGRQVIDRLVQANSKAHLFQVLVTLLKPTDRGSVKIRSNSPYDHPEIVTNYLRSQDDVVTLIEGVTEFKSFEDTRMFETHEIEPVRLPLKECDDKDFGSNSYWECYIRELSTSAHDLVGTNKMGAVVDSKLNVKNVEGLRVIDSSVMPEIISANTYVTEVMIGERGADFVKADWKE